MSSSYRLIGLLVLALVSACAAEPKPVNRVQTNLVDKAVFEGEWWYASTSIDVNYDEAFVFNSANAFAPFSGSMSTDFGLDYNRGGPSVLGDPSYSFPIARVRFVIDENFLFAYRAYELVAGGNLDDRAASYRGEPLAVFKIEDHVDVRKEYSSVTGETTNVTVENTQDRRWFERQFIRVDWSQNLLTQFAANDAQVNELFNGFKRESVPFFVQSGSHPELPSSYQPLFVRVKDDKNYQRANEWSKTAAETVHYMSFVTQEVWSPAEGCLYQGGGACATATTTMRNAFLRIPDGHEYAAQTETNAEFDRFGLFRSHQPTYARGGEDKAIQRKHCFEDSDCGQGGACDNAAHREAECTKAGKPAECRDEGNYCVGGLTGDLGQTDFLSFFASRLNLYSDSLTDTSCAEDWECDNRYAACEAGNASCAQAQTSRCDPAAHRCTTPVAKRKPNPVVFHLSPHFPPYLVREAFEAVAQWNETMMRGQRAVMGTLPFDQEPCSTGSGVCSVDLDKQGRVPCQDHNATAFCYCGSPEAKGGTCRRGYDAFETPDHADERGIPNPYDCYVAGAVDLEHPENYSDYTPKSAYDYSFKGSECLLKLVANSCDVDSKLPCEDLGDIRYHFLTHLQHGGAGFGGIAQPLSDPTNGELVATSATIAAESLESMGTLASQFFPVLRGDVPEDRYFTGENVRGYYAALGHVEHPVSNVVATRAGNEPTTDNSRPTREDDITARMNKAFQKAQKLQGQEGRAAVFSGRTKALRGSKLDLQLAAALEAELPNAKSLVQNTSNGNSSNKGAPQQTPAISALDQTTKELELERQRSIALGTRNMDVFDAQLFNGQYMRYHANAFAKVSPSEASLRMQQGYFRGVLLHEIGHVLGLRHNFAGSLDRNNYPDAYFNVATQTPLPSALEYDNPAHGGNGDRVVSDTELERYGRELRVAREERLSSGAGTVMTASIMDYNSNFSDLAGVGRYDSAAILFSYFDKVEAYATGDPTEDPTTAASMNPPLSLAGLERPDLHRRELWSYYRGGDSCSSDNDCPHRAGRESTAFQPIAQRCIPNPRLGMNSNGVCGKDVPCVCTNLNDDFDAYATAQAYRQRTQPAEFSPVKYLFCHDNRVGDLSWCTRADAGESFQEVVEHYRRSWRERYPRQYFRNFNAGGPTKGGSYGSVVDAVKIYQHMFFRQSYEGQAYNGSNAPLGLSDQFAASGAVLDWMGEIIGTPDVGSYKLDAQANVFRQISDRPGAVGSDLNLGLGEGYYLWSEYQTGLNGFSRLERAGTFLDKLLAIQAITKRDWGLTYQVDEFFYVNFFDAFPEEVIDMFGGLIMHNPRAYAPRASVNADGTPNVQYLATARVALSQNVPVRKNQDATYPAPAIDGTDTETLRDVATIQALSEFPVFYDTSFEQRLLVFKLGSGDGYKIADKRRDGKPICKYGTAGCDEPDFIVYDSDRLHTSYVAVVIDTEGTNKIDEQQVAYQLLLRLTLRQQRIRELTQKVGRSADETIELTRISSELQRDESFLEYLIELERQLGISSYFF